MKARFDHAGGSVEFSRAPMPPEEELAVLQATTEATGGSPFALDPIAIEEGLALAWRSLPLVDVAALEAFFRDVVDGMAEAFTYTDVDGLARSVRLSSPAIRIVERADGVADVSLSLMEA